MTLEKVNVRGVRAGGAGNYARTAGVRYFSVRASVLLLGAGLLAAAVVAATSIAELSKAPLIAVCRVGRITEGPPAPADAAHVEGAIYEYAEARILRAFPEARTANIRVEFFAWTRRNGVNSPDLPFLKTGDLVVLPIAPAAGGWRLTPNRKAAVIPALETPPPIRDPAPNGEEYIHRELAHALVNGTAEQRYAAAEYLRWPVARNEQPFRRLLALCAGEHPNRWLGAGVALLAAQGIPRSMKTAEYAAGAPDTTIGWIFSKLPKTGREEQIIRAMVRECGVHRWGTGISMQEYARHPVLVEELRRALREQRKGSLYVAWSILRVGGQDVLSDSVSLATHTIESGATRLDSPELQPACWIVRDFGSEADFGRLLAAVRAARTANQARYQVLWSASGYSEGTRSARIAAVLIDDTRIMHGDTRYCDVAAGAVLAFAKERFHPAESREQRLSRARGWLRAHHIQ